jgi:hypothetical protein
MTWLDKPPVSSGAERLKSDVRAATALREVALRAALMYILAS